MESDKPDLVLSPVFEEAFGQPGGLLDAPPGSGLHLDIGRRCVGRDSRFLTMNGLMTVVAVQRLYDGTYGYRLHGAEGSFGQPARPQDICWISPEEAVYVVSYTDEDADGQELIHVPASRLAAAEDCIRRLGWRLDGVRELPGREASG